MAPKTTLIEIERPCENPSCGRSFASKINPDGTPARGYAGRFCSRSCARSVENKERSVHKEQEWLASDASRCACGKRIPYALKHTRLYCSDECTKLYGKKKGSDPTKKVTFTCERCGKEVTGYKSQSGVQRFCSIECSARSNTQRSLKVGDAILDSTYEAAVVGWCGTRKVPWVRFDREQAISYNDGWYGPDFVIDNRFYVEVKGLEDDDDRARYDAWRATGRKLVVLDRDRIDQLWTTSDVALLESWEA